MAARGVLIKGASRGLGLALARQLARSGWALILDVRGSEALEAALSLQNADVKSSPQPIPLIMEWLAINVPLK